MVTIFQIDKSGVDIFEKDYAIVLIVDKEKKYGVNIPQKIKDSLICEFKQNKLNIKGPSDKKSKNRFRLRFHTAIVIMILEKAIKDKQIIGNVNIQICNDFDGHFHEIKDMIFKNIVRFIPSLKPEDIVQTKFQKPSLIDETGKAFRNRDKTILKDCIEVKLNSEELNKIIKK